MTKQIRPKGTIAVMEAGTAQVPKEIRDELAVPGKGVIAYVLDAKTALLFNPESDPKDVIDSLKVLEADLKLRIEECDKRKKNVNKGKNV